MTWLNTLLTNFTGLFKWWVVIAPWEQAVRVRAGKHQRLLGAGVHLKVPYVDKVYIQSTRLRYCSIPTQTLTTKDGHAVTTSGIAGFEIADIEKVYNTLHHPDAAVYGEAMDVIAKAVVTNSREACTPAWLAKHVRHQMGSRVEAYGLELRTLAITDFAVVKTFRLLQGEPMDWINNDVDTGQADH